MKRLVLHVGLPKTGTSALQTTASSNYAKLLEMGVEYPLVEGASGLLHPKHQFLVNMLLKDSLERLEPFLEERLAPLVFLSAEGLSNHFFDFPERALANFRAATSGWRKTVFIVLREKDSWLRSLFKQCVINPTNRNYLYGTGLVFEDFCSEARVRRLGDYNGLIDLLSSGYGAEDVFVANYEGDVWFELQHCLDCNVGAMFERASLVNTSLSDELVEIIRQVNALGAASGLRSQFLAYLEKVFGTGNETLAHYVQMSMGTDVSNAEISELVGRLEPITDQTQMVIHRLEQSLAQR